MATKKKKILSYKEYKNKMWLKQMLEIPKEKRTWGSRYYKSCAMKLSKEKRQEVLDAWHSGKKVLEICSTLGVTQYDVIGVMQINEQHYTFYNTVTK